VHNRSREAARVFALLTLVPILAAAPRAGGQQVDRLMTRPDVRALLDTIKAGNAWTLQQQVALCEIPAPPFKEQARGEAYKAAFEKLGLTNVRIDSVGNVIGERRGSANGPVVVIAGHLDTVFPEGTDVTVKRDGDRYVGRGIGDDCRGLAVVLSVARALQQNPIATTGTIVFVGNVGEEGPGNLRGTRHLFAGAQKGGLPKIDYFISVDGAGHDITSRAVGSHRYKVSYKGPGGHSYGAFGNPNPAHALGRAMAAIADFQVPTSPKTTFNVGVIEGGTSVNSIPFEASMEFDMRSESAQALAAIDAKAQRAFRAALAAENARWPKSRYKLTMVVDTIGIRPTGGQPDSAPIVRAAEEAGKLLGLSPKLGASSTDANIPISLGVPGITIDGGGSGGGAHGLDEWYSDGSEGWKGPQWAALILLALVQ
jgi:acetylornithine deacetylase/succinyl-diaminopimelate desuccinylase-like protein